MFSKLQRYKKVRDDEMADNKIDRNLYYHWPSNIQLIYIKIALQIPKTFCNY